MYPCSVRTLRADALFASPLQRGDQASASTIRRAVALALNAYGDAGCAGRVAQEFGDHPETASARMRWARATVAALEGQPAARIWRTASADSSALGTNPAAGLSAIRSA
jgi:hypothetical protein